MDIVYFFHVLNMSLTQSKPLIGTEILLNIQEVGAGVISYLSWAWFFSHNDKSIIIFLTVIFLKS